MVIFIDEKTPLKKFNHHWKFCVGSAHAVYGLRHDYAKQLAQIHKDLGIERVRFHGIFDDNMHTLMKATEIIPFPFGGSYGEQSFRQCANVYDNVIEAGMTPFVELSFMPKRLAKFKFGKGMFFYKPIVSMPGSIEKWQKYIRDFIRFLIERYGKEEIEEWYFEVWNEPDLPVIFFDGTQKDYFKLYSATVSAIKSVDERIKVGGPATSGSKWIKDFVNYCERTGTPVDFISTHQYSGDPIGGVENKDEGLNLNIDFFAALKKRASLNHNNIIDLYRAFMGVADAPKTLNKNALTDSAKNVKAVAGKLPVFYTEWNMCASFSAPCNDTSMQACYQLHSIINSQDSIDGSSIWCLSDLFEEFHQFPEEFHGGFGLMSQSGIKKPSYYALQFLNEAGDDYFDINHESKADIAVFRKNNEFHIIVSLLDFSEKSYSEKLTFKIKSGRPESATLSVINTDSGNPLALWIKAGSPQMPVPELLKEIKEKSKPLESEADYEYKDGYITINISVSSNEIKRIIVRQ